MENKTEKSCDSHDFFFGEKEKYFVRKMKEFHLKIWRNYAIINMRKE